MNFRGLLDTCTLLKNADLAMYEAKRNGRACWCRFQPEQAQELAHHTSIASALRLALAASEITVAFQPKRKLCGDHAGFEALARWYNGSRWVPPSEFIPIAEAAGLIESVGKAVFEKTLSRLQALRQLGHKPGRAAINITSTQLLNIEFIPYILKSLHAFGLKPTDLEFEITETVLLDRSAGEIEKTLLAVRKLGITLAMDDFGTGYASLSHVARLPIDRIKIDKSFVSSIGVGDRGGVLARTVINLAKSLGLECVAEGVETEDQLEFLRSLNCDSVQGFLFSKPLLTLEEADAYLRNQFEIREGNNSSRNYRYHQAYTPMTPIGITLFSATD